MSSRTRSSGTGSGRRRRIARIVVMTLAIDWSVPPRVDGVRLTSGRDRSLEPDQRRVVDVFEVRRVDEAQLSHEPVEQDRVGSGPPREVVDSPQHIAIPHTSRDAKDVVPAREVFRRVDAMFVGYAHLPRAGALFIIAELETAK